MDGQEKKEGRFNLKVGRKAGWSFHSISNLPCAWFRLRHNLSCYAVLHTKHSGTYLYCLHQSHFDDDKPAVPACSEEWVDVMAEWHSTCLGGALSGQKRDQNDVRVAPEVGRLPGCQVTRSDVQEIE